MSDRLRKLSEYTTVYMDNARQLATHRLAREWMEAGVPAVEAAGWASLGFLPHEAAPEIAAGRTPAEVAVIEAAEDAADGGETRRALNEFATLEAAEAAAAGGVDSLLRHRLQTLVDEGVISSDDAKRLGLNNDR